MVEEIIKRHTKKSKSIEELEDKIVKFPLVRRALAFIAVDSAVRTMQKPAVPDFIKQILMQEKGCDGDCENCDIDHGEHHTVS